MRRTPRPGRGSAATREPEEGQVSGGHAASGASPDGQKAEHRRLGRAVETLETTAPRRGRRLLADLAKGASDSRQTREARAALDRLQKRP